MATVTISALTAVLAGDLDDTARVPVDDNDSHTRKATIAQLRTQIFSGAGVPLTCGALTATTLTTSGNLLVSGAALSGTFERRAALGIRIYGEAAATAHQWDIYGSGATLRFSDNTGGGSVLFDTAVSIGTLGAFVAADKYVIVDAAGNLHVSALGPLS